MGRGTNQSDSFAYTISHFKEIARRNLFAENRNVEHDGGRCAVCRPDTAGRDPFEVYLEVIVESVLVRRPVLDEALVSEINRDRAMAGLKTNVTLNRLVEGDRDALDSWAAWVREALAAGLGLLSVHSPTSLDFDLDEQVEKGYGLFIESMIRRLMDHQRVKDPC